MENSFKKMWSLVRPKLISRPVKLFRWARGKRPWSPRFKNVSLILRSQVYRISKRMRDSWLIMWGVARSISILMDNRISVWGIVAQRPWIKVSAITPMWISYKWTIKSHNFIRTRILIIWEPHPPRSSNVKVRAKLHALYILIQRISCLRWSQVCTNRVKR